MTTIIHAFRRTRPHKVHFTGCAPLQFAQNAYGDFVCAVERKEHVDALLAVPTGYRIYDGQGSDDLPPQKRGAAGPKEGDFEVTGDKDANPYLIVGPDGSAVDLKLMDDDALHAFCKANDIKVHPNAKGDTVRDKIVGALRVAG